MGWPSPPGGPCALPPPGVAYPIPSSAAPLVVPLVLHRSSLHGSAASPLSLRCPALLPSLSLRMRCRLLCFPPSLSGCAAGCSAPLPRCSSSRSTAATVPFQIEQTTARRWRNRADGDEEMAELRGRQHAHKAARRCLTPKASQERPDA